LAYCWIRLMLVGGSELSSSEHRLEPMPPFPGLLRAPADVWWVAGAIVLEHMLKPMPPVRG